ncbi:MAG: MFS transporter [Verrucomicrobia bacterium]|nr:MAG: MFS transporter [Verrucomicrobiota bacterium]
MLAFIREPCDENVIRSAPTAAPCSKRAGRWVLVATTLASSMAFIDSTVVNVALPALQANLNATIVDVQWVIEAYSLLLAALLLVGGSLGDHYGRRRIFLLGVAIFTSASVWCGCAFDIRQLIVARAVQGFGAALLVPGSLAIISSSFPESERGRAIGTWSGFSAITTAIGPIVGGWLIEHVTWRAAFFINVPIALLVILISVKFVPESSDKESAGLDWLGAIIGTVGLGALVYGLIESSRLGLGNRSVIVVLVAAILILVVFLFVDFLPLNLIQIQHYSPTAAGAALLPFILIMSLLSRWSGGLITVYGSKLPLIVGPMIVAGGYVLFILPRAGGSYWTTFFPPAVVLGLGMAITVAPLTTTVMSSVSQNRAGVASGVNNAVARTAGLLAIAVLGIVMLQVFKHTLDRRLAESKLPTSVIQSVETQSTKLAAITIPENLDLTTKQRIRQAVDESFVAGFRSVMAIGAALAGASGIVTLALIKTNPRTDQ